MGRRIVSGGCHPVERKNGDFAALRWGACQGASSSGLRSKRRLFIASGTLSGGASPFPHVYDHSLPHSRLAIGDVEGEWCTRAPIGPSHSSPCSWLLPN
ncbi:unnamed protein product [Spirodela intermedia]|uniref:Uncharacterized protein n=1 Tax=Spirodela intermedia TaxID=51605 RepID=A0A7I8LJH0_SPIIN|nr:unnamed protein product [Spirodela intermedia]